MTAAGNAAVIGRFLAAAPDRALPPDATDAAKRCLLDWTGVAIAGAAEPAARAALRYAGLDGAALPLVAAGNPEKAALANGVAGHALDFDDTHIPTDCHISAVTWAAVLAMARQKADGAALLRAFVSGYEVAAKLSGRRFGFSLQFRWFHPTGVIGRMASASAAAVLRGLDETRAAHAVALALTQASGLRGSMGGMGKPFQAGRAAMDGIASAALAEAGMEAALGLLEPDGGFDRAFVQDGSAKLAALGADALGADWAVLRTSFKPYACLHGVHPSIDAARELAPLVAAGKITAIRAYVAPGVKEIARFTDPQSPLEAKFSVAFCVALGLSGRDAGVADFSRSALDDPVIRQRTALVEVLPEDGRKMLDSAVAVDMADGRRLRAETELSRGHPGNPLRWDELEGKFLDLAEPALGARAKPLAAALRNIDAPGALTDIQSLLRGPRA